MKPIREEDLVLGLRLQWIGGDPSNTWVIRSIRAGTVSIQKVGSTEMAPAYNTKFLLDPTCWRIDWEWYLKREFASQLEEIIRDD